MLNRIFERKFTRSQQSTERHATLPKQYCFVILNANTNNLFTEVLVFRINDIFMIVLSKSYENYFRCNFNYWKIGVGYIYRYNKTISVFVFFLKLWSVFMVSHKAVGYELKCPDSSHRAHRIRIICKEISSKYEHYSCLYNMFKNTYDESCSETADFVRPGKYDNWFKTNKLQQYSNQKNQNHKFTQVLKKVKDR